MWNYSFVFPSLLILIIIVLYYSSLPHLRIRKNRAFIQMIVIEMMVILLDIASSVADNNYQTLSPYLVDALNTLYFVCFFCRTYIMFVFTMSVLQIHPQNHPVTAFFIRLPLYLCLFFSCSSPLTGMMYHMEADGYHFGYLYNALYYCTFFYLALSFIAFFIKKDHLASSRARISLLFFNIILLLGIIMRKALPTYLLMDTFCLMAIIVVYLGFENPEFYLELRSTVFNSNALRLYLDEYNRHTRITYFAFVIHKYNEMREIYGSTQMDEGLSMIGRFLTKSFPGRPIFYFSRGRFIVICDGNADVDAMRNKVTSRFKEPWRSEYAEIFLDVNFAIYTGDHDAPPTGILLDTFSYALSKSDFANDSSLITINADDILFVQEERVIKKCFETAIENNGIEVFLQPLIDIKTKNVIGAEALARLYDNHGNIISPGLFIPIAENSGLINELGEQVFEKTCSFIANHDISAMGIQWINVNLSPLQFIRDDLADRYADIVLRYNIPPGLIHLEITEAAIIDDKFFQKQISALTQKGFLLVLDDYGTGYSNLTRIKKCPFTNIKLDMELVRDFCDNPDEILPTMIHAFKHMGFSITAEGIEDEDIALSMEKIGADYLQGFHYSKPLPMDEFLKYVSSSQM